MSFRTRIGLIALLSALLVSVGGIAFAGDEAPPAGEETPPVDTAPPADDAEGEGAEDEESAPE